MKRQDSLSAVAAVAALVVMALAPAYLGAYGLDVLFTLLLYAGLAQAWNVIGGFGGQFSLGNAAFFGAGAYVAAVLLTRTSASFPVALLAAAAFAGVGAVVLGLALFRLRGVYFSIGTLAAALAAALWMLSWNYTGASSGLNLPFDRLPTAKGQYYVVLVVAALGSAVAALIPRTALGVRLLAVRDDEDAAVTVGVSGLSMKLGAFAISALLTGPLGAVYAAHQISIEPNSAFALSWTITMIVVAIVGGIGTAAGPLLGAAIVYYGIEKQLEGYANLSAILTGILLIGIVRFAPEGVWGVLVAGARRARAAVAAPRAR